MDTQAPLQNPGEAWRRLRTFDRLAHVFCGHYHTERTLWRDGRGIFLCPSTLFQIDPYPDDFRVAHSRPGFRLIDWDGDELTTWVEYLG